MIKRASLVRGHANPCVFKDISSHHIGQGTIRVNKTTDKSTRVSLGEDLHQVENYILMSPQSPIILMTLVRSLFRKPWEATGDLWMEDLYNFYNKIPIHIERLIKFSTNPHLAVSFTNYWFRQGSTIDAKSFGWTFGEID